MSDGIQLTDQMIDEILQVIVKQAPETEKDLGVALQYMAAMIGILAAEFPGTQAQRDDFLNELATFSKHVANQQTARDEEPGEAPEAATEPAPSKGRCEADPDDPAAGVWRADT